MRIGIVAVVFLTLVSLLVGCQSGAARRASAPPADGRTLLRVPAEAREAVLTEMRTMLGSVQGVLDGASRGDTVAVRVAAMASGMATAADPALEKLLPEQFLSLGVATHLAFDSLAVNAAAGPAASVRALAGITGTCVACHATFRLEAR